MAQGLKKTGPIFICYILSIFLVPRWGIPQQDFRLGVKVEMVSIFASVHDRKGKVVTDLSQNDFALFDNDNPQPMFQFSREYMPLSVVVLLDVSSSMEGKKLDNARKSLIQFLKQLNPGDEAMLMTFNSRPVVVQDFTQDLDRVRHALKKVDANGSTALYDAILKALTLSARNAHNRRRVLLLISDGINTYGTTELNETVSRLRHSGSELFAIGIETDIPEEVPYNAITNAVLDQLTGSAGGESFVVMEPKDLNKVCGEISDRMHHQYTFAYYPPKGVDGQWHSVRVEALLPGLKVIPSKTGYYRSTDK